jgi:acetylornithine deacetylase/succinyl-diaminopimelate desuccinylase-like protein
MTGQHITPREQAVLDAGSQWIDDNADSLITLLTDLVACPGLSGDEGVADDPSTTTGTLYEWLDTALDGPSFAIDVQRLLGERDYVDAPRDNLYTVVEGVGDDGLVCTSHTDVVPAGDPTAWPNDDPFTVTEGVVRWHGGTTVELELAGEVYEREIREKMARIWRLRDREEAPVLVGRGVYDNKASSVCLVGSLLGLQAALEGTDIRFGGDLVHGHLVDEEVYQLGAKEMVGWHGAENWLGDRYDSLDGFAAVVLEGSYGFVPVIGHRGLVWVVLEAEGTAAHASTPELGANAVVEMSRALAALDETLPERLGEVFVEDDLLGRLTVAPGTTIVGGGVERVDVDSRTVERSALNSIPDWCESTLDLRIPRWTDFPEGVDAVCDRIVERVEALANEAASDVSFEASVPDQNYFPPVALAASAETAADHPLVRTAAASVRSQFGYEPGVEVAPGVTDAAFLYHGTRVPTLVEYGPGGGLSHEALEFVERQQVVDGAKVMLELSIRHLGVVGEQ